MPPVRREDEEGRSRSGDRGRARQEPLLPSERRKKFVAERKTGVTIFNKKGIFEEKETPHEESTSAISTVLQNLRSQLSLSQGGKRSSL